MMGMDPMMMGGMDPGMGQMGQMMQWHGNGHGYARYDEMGMEMGMDMIHGRNDG